MEAPARMVTRIRARGEGTVLERGGDAGETPPVRREFQFPGDLWLPRRENRCRQPPNNHTSYNYHTPGVYTRAPYPLLSLSLRFPLARTRTLLRLFLLAFFISTCLITNSRAYLPPRSLEKNCRGFELLRVTLPPFFSRSLSLSISRAARITIRYSSGRDSNYPRKCELLFIGRLYVSKRYSGRCFLRNFERRPRIVYGLLSFFLFFYLFFPIFAWLS